MTRCATTAASPVSLISVKRIVNSSPPKRAIADSGSLLESRTTSSMLRTDPTRRSATSFSTSSPRGCPRAILGHFHGARSGHTLNNALLRALFEDELSWCYDTMDSSDFSHGGWAAEPLAKTA